MMDKVALAETFARIEDLWVPRIVGELNGQYVKVVKAEGEYVWHHHEHEDELFLVVSGRLDICLRDRVIELSPGEFFVVPRGVEHKPVSHGVSHLLLFEPASTRNTGNVEHAYTIEADQLERM